MPNWLFFVDQLDIVYDEIVYILKFSKGEQMMIDFFLSEDKCLCRGPYFWNRERRCHIDMYELKIFCFFSRKVINSIRIGSYKWYILDSWMHA